MRRLADRKIQGHRVVTLPREALEVLDAGEGDRVIFYEQDSRLIVVKACMEPAEALD